MTTITTKTVAGSAERTTLIESGLAEAGDTVDISGFGPDIAHCYVSVQMFDAAGDQIVDSAGTFAIEIATWNNGVLEDPPVASIDATAPVTIGWEANTTRVVVTPSSLSDTDTWRVRVSLNRT
jgi:hypothetical protein